MLGRTRMWYVGLLALALSSLPVGAQTSDPLATALVAFRDLDFDAAASRLRSALALSGTARLSEVDRARALMHLGATELFRTRRDAAIDAFRSLLVLDPKYRPDELVFPPEVAALFHETRIGVRSVAITVPPEVVLRNPSERVLFRLHASTLHSIQATIRGPGGQGPKTLHDGAIGDSLDLLWDARGGEGAPGVAGPHILRVTSLSPDGRAERTVEMRLVLSWDAVDTLPSPSVPEPRPETAAPTGRLRPLAVGLAGAAVTALLPELVGASGSGSAMRFGVAGSLGVAGIVAAAVASRPRTLPENVTWNQATRREWDREVARVSSENAARRASATARVRASRATVVEAR